MVAYLLSWWLNHDGFIFDVLYKFFICISLP
jgi:hypothetical protein